MAIDEGGCLPPARCARPPEDIWGKMKRGRGALVARSTPRLGHRGGDVGLHLAGPSASQPVPCDKNGTVLVNGPLTVRRKNRFILPKISRGSGGWPPVPTSDTGSTARIAR